MSVSTTSISSSESPCRALILGRIYTLRYSLNSAGESKYANTPNNIPSSIRTVGELFSWESNPATKALVSTIARRIMSDVGPETPQLKYRSLLSRSELHEPSPFLLNYEHLRSVLCL